MSACCPVTRDRIGLRVHFANPPFCLDRRIVREEDADPWVGRRGPDDLCRDVKDSIASVLARDLVDWLTRLHDLARLGATISAGAGGGGRRGGGGRAGGPAADAGDVVLETLSVEASSSIWTMSELLAARVGSKLTMICVSPTKRSR